MVIHTPHGTRDILITGPVIRALVDHEVFTHFKQVLFQFLVRLGKENLQQVLRLEVLVLPQSRDYQFFANQILLRGPVVLPQRQKQIVHIF